MTSDDIKNKFKSFLQEKGLLETFDKNVNCLDATNLEDFFAYRLSPYSWVRAAFVWGNTPKGFSFWEKVESDWVKTLDEIY